MTLIEKNEEYTLRVTRDEAKIIRQALSDANRYLYIEKSSNRPASLPAQNAQLRKLIATLCGIEDIG